MNGVVVTVGSSPKQKFQSIKSNLDQHKDLIQRADFNLSLDTALAQYVYDITKSPRPELASALFFQIEGAHQFVATLKTLAEQSTIKPATLKSDNLQR